MAIVLNSMGVVAQFNRAWKALQDSKINSHKKKKRSHTIEIQTSSYSSGSDCLPKTNAILLAQLLGLFVSLTSRAFYVIGQCVPWPMCSFG